ncbi:threonine ammonia-lyase IlvA [Flavobacterium plurextorum]|uniref:threonine ammonia-lyase IlvA n=1 Tax=Flavobacterium TaxID=237 RepID=UPI00214DCA34|nr:MULTISPECIES: threonine ammonia-lyase IlvA [Flavobacterium]UUW08475.1 threonine ammonia-lyase IlvA [Flavobacterium plurextorum]
MNLFKEIQLAQKQLAAVIVPTPLLENLSLSKHYNAVVLLKREDLQAGYSFKIRGVYNKINSLSVTEKERGIVCASDGNHAQGVAYCCELLKIMGKIYLPKNTSKQRLEQIQKFGKEYIKIILTGDYFEEAYSIALGDASIHRKAFIHPFDDLKVIAGQATAGLEILEDCQNPIDYVFVPLEGSGLAAGISSAFKMLSPNTKIIGVTTQENPSLEITNENDPSFDVTKSYLNNASIKKQDDLTSNICKENLDDLIKISEGKICSTILKLANNKDTNIEHEGVLSIAALDFYADKIKGKNVVCIINGGLKNIEKEAEIKERSLLYDGLVHYFMIQSPQRSEILKDFISNILGPDDEITHFQFVQKENFDAQSVFIRLETKEPNNIEAIKTKMQAKEFQFQNLNDRNDLFSSNINLENILWEEKQDNTASSYV